MNQLKAASNLKTRMKNLNNLDNQVLGLRKISVEQLGQGTIKSNNRKMYFYYIYHFFRKFFNYFILLHS